MNLPAFFREYLPYATLKMANTALAILMANNLKLDPDAGRESAGHKRGKYCWHFLSATVMDDDLPWDITVQDFSGGSLGGFGSYGDHIRGFEQEYFENLIRASTTYRTRSSTYKNLEG